MIRTPEKAIIPELTRMLERIKKSERAKTLDRGKAPMAQASLAPTPDCMIVDRWVPPPSQGTLARERRAASASGGRNRERTIESDHSPRHGSRKKMEMVVVERSGSGDGSWEEESVADDSDEEATPSLNIRRAFTKLQERRLLTP